MNPPTPSRGRRRRHPSSEDALADVAMRYLKRFPTTAKRLAEFLRRKMGDAVTDGACDQREASLWVDAVVQRMMRARVLDDGRWAASRARVLHRRGRPLTLIKRDLAHHGVAGPLIADALGELAEEHPDGDLAAAQALARRRRLGPWAPPEERRAKRERHLAALARAGFSFDLARRVIDAAPGV